MPKLFMIILFTTFSEARGYSIERANYVADLKRVKENSPLDVSKVDLSAPMKSTHHKKRPSMKSHGPPRPFPPPLPMGPPMAPPPLHRRFMNGGHFPPPPKFGPRLPPPGPPPSGFGPMHPPMGPPSPMGGRPGPGPGGPMRGPPMYGGPHAPPPPPPPHHHRGGSGQGQPTQPPLFGGPMHPPPPPPASMRPRGSMGPPAGPPRHSAGPSRLMGGPVLPPPGPGPRHPPLMSLAGGPAGPMMMPPGPPQGPRGDMPPPKGLPPLRSGARSLERVSRPPGRELDFTADVFEENLTTQEYVITQCRRRRRAFMILIENERCILFSTFDHNLARKNNSYCTSKGGHFTGRKRSITGIITLIFL
ncbi:unnamed protein product [Trichogramma brassicae]|uniref:Uncharacterized protein n=1 Tax=Trichogramma brassicae TaxID=86971 RepID=A0A6H5J564_9HYME|nr:unnamed protein product [Trichogramma brassicae]